MRQRTAADSATPAGIGVLAEVFARLWHLTGEAAWRERAEALLRAFAGKPEQFAAMPTLLAAADLLEEAATVVIAGDPAHPLAQALAAAALARGGSGGRGAAGAEPRCAAGRTIRRSASRPGAEGAAAYVCRRNVCGMPMADGDALASALSARAW